LTAVTDRLTACEAEALKIPVDFPPVQRLTLPVASGTSRVPGIQIHHTRMIRLPGCCWCNILSVN
jgi:hypothetical protein